MPEASIKKLFHFERIWAKNLSSGNLQKEMFKLDSEVLAGLMGHQQPAPMKERGYRGRCFSWSSAKLSEVASLLPPNCSSFSASSKEQPE